MTSTAFKQATPVAQGGTPWWLWLHSLATYLFLYAPILFLVVYSFSASDFSTVWGGFTTKWYAALWEDENRLTALKRTLQLAAISTILGGLLGTSAAVGQARMAARPRKWMETLFFLPIAVPDIVIALALLACLQKLLHMGPTESFLRMIIGHTVLTTCYVYMVVNTRLKGFDWRLMEAARDLGANAWQAFRYVQLPLLWPGVVGGMLLAFAISLDEYVISSFLKGPGNSTLPINIQGAIKRSFNPSINALATLMLCASVLLAILSALVQRKGKAR